MKTNIEQSIRREIKNKNRNNNHGSYGKYLIDKRWKEYRKTILKRDQYKCIVCGSVENLQVHHKQYHFSTSTRTFRMPWDYPKHLLITICRKCHEIGHRKYKVPTKYIK
jgi:5-methylcytosine-specific restriction endonuclease McrA